MEKTEKQIQAAELKTVQAAEIKAICHRMGITYKELAARVPMHEETMRKLFHGYQSTDEWKMKQIRQVETQAAMLKDSPVSQPSSAYRFMKLETLQKNFVEVSSELVRASKTNHRYIIGNLRDMLDELERREFEESSEPEEKLGPAPAPDTPKTKEEFEKRMLKKGFSSGPKHTSNNPAVHPKVIIPNDPHLEGTPAAREAAKHKSKESSSPGHLPRQGTK